MCSCGGTQVKIDYIQEVIAYTKKIEAEEGAKRLEEGIAECIAARRSWNRWFGWLSCFRYPVDPEEVLAEFKTGYFYRTTFELNYKACISIPKIKSLCQVASGDTIFLTSEELDGLRFPPGE